jgi:hypothetical protein
MKVYSIALTASVGAVMLLLLASSQFETEEGRIDVPKPPAADAWEAESISADMAAQYEAQAARFHNCDVNAVIYSALQTTGGGIGPIC